MDIQLDEILLVTLLRFFGVHISVRASLMSRMSFYSIAHCDEGHIFSRGELPAGTAGSLSALASRPASAPSGSGIDATDGIL
jgi:hypothetical protein